VLGGAERLRRTAEHRHDLTSGVLAALRELCACRDLPAVVAAVRKSARALTGADGVTFILRVGDDCYDADEEAVAPLWEERRFPLGACVSGWAMLNRQSVVIEDVYADPRVPAGACRLTFVKSLVIVPVRSHDPIAAVGVYWARPRRPTEEELSALEALADAVASTLDNLERYQDLRASVERERAARAEADAARAQAEAALAEAEAASRAKDDFLAVLGHELRTPLTAILGWARMLRSSHLDPESRQTGLEVIERNALLQARLVEDLLDVSRIVAGKFDVAFAGVDFKAVVTAALQSHRLTADARGIRPMFECDAPEVPIHGDANRLQQAVSNLLSNAIKFSPDGSPVRITLTVDDAQANIVVEDAGEGIEPEFLRNVFDRFRQQDPTIARRHGGLGLGLAITHHIVSAHGGSIRAESEGRGKGARLTVVLPRSR
jgi:two-component system CheB/CheR fusion protein